MHAVTFQLPSNTLTIFNGYEFDEGSLENAFLRGKRDLDRGCYFPLDEREFASSLNLGSTTRRMNSKWKRYMR